MSTYISQENIWKKIIQTGNTTARSSQINPYQTHQNLSIKNLFPGQENKERLRFSDGKYKYIALFKKQQKDVM